MTQFKVFILKGDAIDGFTTGTIVIGEIATLTHKTRNDTMEDAILVAETLLPSAKGTEILSGLGYHIGTQLKRIRTFIDLYRIVPMNVNAQEKMQR